MRQILKFEVYVHGPYEPDSDICVELYTKYGTATKDRTLHFGVQQPLDQGDYEFIASRIEEVMRGTMSRTLGFHQKLGF